MSERQKKLIGLEAKDSGPVTCLGHTFENDGERRTYFLERLREKLRDPEFRKTEGFPLGADEDILALSDPPYYTACPNPFLAEFVKLYGNPYDPAVEYRREPFSTDVSEGKNDPVYNAHSYHTKVPHKAIMRYIEHYTSPGDIVLDAFCGTGMSGVAAQLSGRHSILVDLSPAATFLASNFCVVPDIESFELDVESLESVIESDIRSLYRLVDADRSEYRSFTIYSTIVECENCQFRFDQWTASFDPDTRQVRDKLTCPSCSHEFAARAATHVMTDVFDPILAKVIRTKKRVQRFSRLTGSGGSHDAWCDDDGNDYTAFAKDILQERIPADALPEMYESHYKRNLAAEGISHVHQFYTPRNLLACARLNRIARDKGPMFLFAFLNTAWHGTLQRRYNAGGGHRPKTNTLYIPALSSEGCVADIYEKKLADLKRFLRAKESATLTPLISTLSATDLAPIPSDSVDYIFLDPPFGANIMYSDLNFLWESWLKVRTNSKEEAIENHVQHKGLPEYQELMKQSFQECFRVLKPGRWMTVEFHNSKNAVWNAISESITYAGFVIADVRTLSKKQGSITQYTARTAVKDDLVISAYKPSDALEESFKGTAGTPDAAWDFVRGHLSQLPVFSSSDGKAETIVERQNYLLFDRMVAFHVQRGAAVPLSASEFYAGLDERFAMRDGMYFLPEQVAEYDKKRMTVREVLQLQLFVTDETSAIHWLKQQLVKKPQTFQELHPQFLREIGGWQKHEKPLELSELLEQNFLIFDGKGQLPSQVHSYLSSNFRELRNLPKNDARLQEKGKDRWYVPDPNKAGDLEKLRERTLLREFEEYREAKVRRLKIVRQEAVRIGFKKAWQERDYATIISVAQKIPENVLQEDPKLLMWYDQALTRTGDEG